MRNLWIATSFLLACAACGDDDDDVIVGDAGADAASDASDGGKTGPCGAIDENEPNDTRDTAEAIALGATVRGCIADENDNDDYEITIPAGMAGGYVQVELDEVGDDTPRVEVFAVSDNGRFGDAQADNNGGDVSGIFAAAPGATYRLHVVDGVIGVVAPYRYSLRTTFTAVEDEHEPNDTRDDATTITAGTGVDATFFAGHETGDEPGVDDYDDWYRVTLAAGNPTFEVSNVPTNVFVNIVVQNSDGMQVAYGGSSDPGATALVTADDMLPAGDYLVHLTVGAAMIPLTFVPGDEPPDSYTRSYTLLVTP